MDTPQGLLIPQLQSRLTISIVYRKGFTVFVNNELASMVKEKHFVHSLQLKRRLKGEHCFLCRIVHTAQQESSLKLDFFGLRGNLRIL
jgi:hypothetical protein